MDLKEIRQLIRFLSNTDVKEIEIQEGETSLRISRALNEPPTATTTVMTGMAPVSIPTAPVPAAAPSPEKPVRSAGGSEETGGETMIIRSPMVGTYYQAASPEAPAFVAKGDIIRKGQVVCIVEAMKLMNEIESEFSGRVVRIAKENASPVEYGETLFVLEPV